MAETLLNPWGDDEVDFQINFLIDRNFQVKAFHSKFEQYLVDSFPFSRQHI